ncbi:MAG: sulfatase [Capsulimonadaceae bacterium]|nr:sulfatase [Capsulimonadaceae bacterium]
MTITKGLNDAVVENYVAAAIMNAVDDRGILKAEAQLSGARSHPNLLFVFGDQWRAQAFGYAGDVNAATPNIDRFAAQSFNFTTAVANTPVCGPSRASLLTGQYPLKHGVFVNDVPVRPTCTAFGEALAGEYDTAYIGKWHIDGHGRSAFIPRDRRLGFDFWRGFECSHEYFGSNYYADDGRLATWAGYDAISQTDEAIKYISEHKSERPFALFVSWGPPHSPYDQVPGDYKARFPADGIQVPANVPAHLIDRARRDLAGYYAHGAALDDCFGRLLEAIRDADLSDETIVIFTSDHGDTLQAHGSLSPKQQPWDESIRVPLLIRMPGANVTGQSGFPIGVIDLMPTCLGLCGLPVPAGVDGADRSGIVRGDVESPDEPALISNFVPFHEAARDRGGREWRAIRTTRWTYARDLNGPWLLYDNEADPLQSANLVDDAAAQPVRDEMDRLLWRELAKRADEFLPGDEYLQRWGYVSDAANNQVPNRF